MCVCVSFFFSGGRGGLGIRVTRTEVTRGGVVTTITGDGGTCFLEVLRSQFLEGVRVEP